MTRKPSRSYGGKVRALVPIALAAASMLCFAVGAQGMARRYPISLHEAQSLAKTANSDSSFPIVVNAAVVKELNYYLATPGGRATMRQSLANMQHYAQLVRNASQKYRLPSELAAIPIVESGYRNIALASNPAGAAGLWMFIPATARSFGLKVTNDVDERLNVHLETDAAMRLLAALNLQFKDWELAVLAYNAGPRKVLAGIRQTKSRDAWRLIAQGHEGDPNYLAKVIAAMLILKSKLL